jgi:predicted secreted acid phosphatase
MQTDSPTQTWIVLANPAYGSFESAPYGHDFKLSDRSSTGKLTISGVGLPMPM